MRAVEFEIVECEDEFEKANELVCRWVQSGAIVECCGACPKAIFMSDIGIQRWNIGSADDSVGWESAGYVDVINMVDEVSSVFNVYS